MSELNFLSLADALAIHAVLIKRYGGSDGLRDIGALESALSRPQSGYYKDVVECAAALLESLVVNHPFIDGNKRVAFAATDIFLRINGFAITAESSEIYKEMMKFFDSGTFKKATLEPWLREITSPT